MILTVVKHIRATALIPIWVFLSVVALFSPHRAYSEPTLSPLAQAMARMFVWEDRQIRMGNPLDWEQKWWVKPDSDKSYTEEDLQKAYQELTEAYPEEIEQMRQKGRNIYQDYLSEVEEERNRRFGKERGDLSHLTKIRKNLEIFLKSQKVTNLKKPNEVQINQMGIDYATQNSIDAATHPFEKWGSLPDASMSYNRGRNRAQFQEVYAPSAPKISKKAYEAWAQRQYDLLSQTLSEKLLKLITLSHQQGEGYRIHYEKEDIHPQTQKSKTVKSMRYFSPHFIGTTLDDGSRFEVKWDLDEDGKILIASSEINGRNHNLTDSIDRSVSLSDFSRAQQAHSYVAYDKTVDAPLEAMEELRHEISELKKLRDEVFSPQATPKVMTAKFIQPWITGHLERSKRQSQPQFSEALLHKVPDGPLGEELRELVWSRFSPVYDEGQDYWADRGYNSWFKIHPKLEEFILNPHKVPSTWYRTMKLRAMPFVLVSAVVAGHLREQIYHSEPVQETLSFIEETAEKTSSWVDETTLPTRTWVSEKAGAINDWVYEKIHGTEEEIARAKALEESKMDEFKPTEKKVVPRDFVYDTINTPEKELEDAIDDTKKVEPDKAKVPSKQTREKKKSAGPTQDAEQAGQAHNKGGSPDNHSLDPNLEKPVYNIVFMSERDTQTLGLVPERFTLGYRQGLEAQRSVPVFNLGHVADEAKAHYALHALPSYKKFAGEDGIILLPRAQSDIPVQVKLVSSKFGTMTPGEGTFEVRLTEKGQLYAKVDEKLRGYPLGVAVFYEKKKVEEAPSNHEVFKNLDKQRILEIAQEMKESGLEKQGTFLEYEIKEKIKQGKKVSVGDLAPMLRTALLYSYQEGALDATKPVEDFSRLLGYMNDSGELCLQCDGAAAFAQTFFTKLFKGSNPPVEISLERLLVRDPTSYQLLQKSFHAEVHLRVQGERPFRVVDLTPGNMDPRDVYRNTDPPYVIARKKLEDQKKKRELEQRIEDLKRLEQLQKVQQDFAEMERSAKEKLKEMEAQQDQSEEKSLEEREKPPAPTNEQEGDTPKIGQGDSEFDGSFPIHPDQKENRKGGLREFMATEADKDLKEVKTDEVDKQERVSPHWFEAYLDRLLGTPGSTSYPHRDFPWNPLPYEEREKYLGELKNQLIEKRLQKPLWPMDLLKALDKQSVAFREALLLGERRQWSALEPLEALSLIHQYEREKVQREEARALLEKQREEVRALKERLDQFLPGRQEALEAQRLMKKQISDGMPDPLVAYRKKKALMKQQEDVEAQKEPLPQELVDIMEGHRSLVRTMVPFMPNVSKNTPITRTVHLSGKVLDALIYGGDVEQVFSDLRRHLGQPELALETPQQVREAFQEVYEKFMKLVDAHRDNSIERGKRDYIDVHDAESLAEVQSLFRQWSELKWQKYLPSPLDGEEEGLAQSLENEKSAPDCQKSLRKLGGSKYNIPAKLRKSI